MSHENCGNILWAALRKDGPVPLLGNSLMGWCIQTAKCSLPLPGSGSDLGGRNRLWVKASGEQRAQGRVRGSMSVMAVFAHQPHSGIAYRANSNTGATNYSMAAKPETADAIGSGMQLLAPTLRLAAETALSNDGSRAAYAIGRRGGG
jgi:hypothetical protein